VIFSHTQIGDYLRCPRNYRYRYLDGWREKGTRAGMVFGRRFEKAFAALLRQEDCSVTLFEKWGFEHKKGETWDRLFRQGIQLLERFSQENRTRTGTKKTAGTRASILDAIRDSGYRKIPNLRSHLL
jgi:PD-(D/E)XK nuclease superfamily